MAITIVDKRKSPVQISFDQLGIGETFQRTGGTVYIKTGSATSSSHQVNAVDLMTGRLIYFEADKVVYPVNTTLTINNNLCK